MNNFNNVREAQRQLQHINFNIDSHTSQTEEEQAAERGIYAEAQTTTRSLSITPTYSAPIRPTPLKPSLGNLNRLNYRLVNRSVITRNDTTYQMNSTSSDTLAASVLYDTLYISLPSFFTTAPNSKKSVGIIIARLFDLAECKEIVGSIHSTLVQFDASANNYCCSSNLLYSEPKRFTIADNTSIFEVWCRDLNGSIIDLDPAKTRLILELVLEF